MFTKHGKTLERCSHPSHRSCKKKKQPPHTPWKYLMNCPLVRKCFGIVFLWFYFIFPDTINVNHFILKFLSNLNITQIGNIFSYFKNFLLCLQPITNKTIITASTSKRTYSNSGIVWNKLAKALICSIISRLITEMCRNYCLK